MNQKSIEDHNAEKQKELHTRVSKELETHNGKNFLERYALYMLRIQMYELSLKQDLQELFNVTEEQVDRMSLSSIFRYYVDNDIRTHPILYVNIQDIARQRNNMAHEFLALAGSLSQLAGNDAIRLFQKDLDRWVYELELAYQQYSILKETNELYKDWGVKPAYNP